MVELCANEEQINTNALRAIKFEWKQTPGDDAHASVAVTAPTMRAQTDK